MATASSSSLSVGVVDGNGRIVTFGLLSGRASCPRYCQWNNSTSYFSSVPGVTRFQPGFVIYAASNTVFEASRRGFVDTDININLPEGYSGIIVDAPGTRARATRICMTLTLDSSSILPLKIPMLNTSHRNIVMIRMGEPIAYIIVYKLYEADVSRLAFA